MSCCEIPWLLRLRDSDLLRDSETATLLDSEQRAHVNCYTLSYGEFRDTELMRIASSRKVPDFALLRDSETVETAKLSAIACRNNSETLSSCEIGVFYHTATL